MRLDNASLTGVKLISIQDLSQSMTLISNVWGEFDT